jgi:hypothetical protein
MKFVLVNGRTPRTQSFCALCCQSIGENYLRDIAARHRAANGLPNEPGSERRGGIGRVRLLRIVS